MAAHARGITVFREVGEARVKETDRIAAVIDGLGLLGVNAWMDGNDLYIEGNPGLQVPEGLRLSSGGDHRLAMTWALAGLVSESAVVVEDFEAVSASYPGFLGDIRSLVRRA